jgi:hypothetical protein
MDFKDKNRKFGKELGFIFSYFIFTTILFFVLKTLNKLPLGWNYFYIMWITLLIVLVGLLFRRFLE